MAYGDRSYSKDGKGRTTEVKIDKGNRTDSYKTYYAGSKTAKTKTGSQPHKKK